MYSGASFKTKKKEEKGLLGKYKNFKSENFFVFLYF